MILRITFDNILSFKSETVISFVAGKERTHSRHVNHAKTCNDISLLRASVIYGANAAGKSNIIKAVAALKDFALGVRPIALEQFKPNTDIKPSSIEIEFKTPEGYWAYGVTFNQGDVIEEWLSKENKAEDTIIFERKKTEQGNAITYGNMPSDEQISRFILFLGQATPKDKSFLSEYVQRNGQGLEAVRYAYNWFAHTLNIIFPATRYQGLLVRSNLSDNFKRETNELLRYFNTGITGLSLVKMRSKEETGLPDALLKRVINDAGQGQSILLSSGDNENFLFIFNKQGSPDVYKQMAVHATKHAETVFNMHEESDGTLRLLDFIPMLLDLRHNDAVYLIDEMDRSMHPKMSYEILKYFLDGNESRSSQLIITTHEIGLLDMELLRTDEIWFAEKDNNGATSLYSLAEYKPRADIKKGYLNGRYGAIPCFGCPTFLNWNSDAQA